MRVLVTGASGLAGSHAVERLLAGGHTVRALVRPTSDLRFLRGLDVELTTGDVTAPETLAAAVAGCEGIIHTAAVVGGWGRPEAFFRVGVLGTRNLLIAARDAGVRRFVHLSSIAVYGDDLDGRLLRETDPYGYRPRTWNHYVREKVQSEQIVFSYHLRGWLETTAVRPSVIWGARDRIAFPTAAALVGGPFAAIVGRGRNRIPCAGVRDVADVAVRALESPRAAGRAYNVSSGREITQRQLYRLIARALGRRVPRLHVPPWFAFGLATLCEGAYCAARIDGPPPLTRFNVGLIASDVRVDCAAARDELGWRELHPVPQAIAEDAAWARAAGRRATGG
jgi:nucleoside-diphosphate-sugar epimerase